MNCKRLLLMLLVALLAPWAAMGQNTITLTGNVTQTIEPNTTYNFYDSGGPDSSYGTSQNYTATLTCVGDITINFSQFVTESSSSCSDWDHMHIYDGTASNGTLLARGQTGCSSATLTTGVDYVASSGTMTIVWKSDGTSVAAGWAATITGSEASSCPKPTGLVASNITHNEAKLSWTENGTATSWQVCLNNDETNLITANSNPYTLTGLTPTTAYTAKVRAIGNDEYSVWSNEVSFSTTAVAEVVGDSWNDDFEGTACEWELVNGTQTNVWAWGTAVNNGGSHSLYVSNDNGTTNAYSHTTSTVFATKLLNFTEGKFEFSYNWKANGESTYDYLRVALAPADATITAGNYSFTSSSLPTGWIALDGGSKLNLVTAWQSQSVAVNVPAGNYYLVMAWHNDGSGGTTPPAAVDNVSITRVACGYDVTDLAAGNITTNSADITWTAGEATGWQVAYKTNAASEWTENEPVSTNSAPLSGLAASTNYQVKVRAYCGGQDYGSWCDPITFATECDVFTDLDENFDSYTGATSGSTNNLPLCWNFINTSTYSSNQGYPVIYNNQSSSNSGNNHLRFYSYYTTSTYTNYDPQPQYAILPAIEDVNTMRIKLYARANSTSSYYNSTFKVGVMTDPTNASTFSEVATYTPASTTYEQYVLPLDSYTGTGTYIAIMIEAAEAFGGYTYGYRSVFIDDIIVEPIPSCLEPTDLTANNITSSSAIVSWVSDANTFKLEIKKHTEETWTIATINSNSHTYNELEANTTYDIRVTAVCNTDPWEASPSVEFNFTTACGAVSTLPWSEDFDSYAGSTSASAPSGYPNDEMPSCWQFLNRSTSSGSYPQVFISSNSGYPVSGKCLFFKSSSSTPLYAVLPEFSSVISGLELSFTYRNEGTSSSNGTLYVGYMTDPTDATTFTSVLTCEQTTTLTTKKAFFNGAPAGSYIAFKYQGGSSDNYYLSIDNVTVSEAVFITANQIVNIVNDPATEMTWSQFVQYWNNGDNFTHTTFTLMEDIAINKMVGTAENPFSGTFDGDYHAITVDLTATDNNFTAPFRIIRNATIQNLKVDGTINDGGFKFCAGFAGDCYGNNIFTNCESAVTIDATTEGDGTHGGFIARNYGGSSSSSSNLCTTVFNGCAFTGKLLGASTNQSAGFCGWSEYYSPNYAKTIFNNCLFAPQAVTMSTTSSATFARRRNATYVNFNNCYFMRDFNDGTNNTAQGKQAYTIAGVDAVDVAFSGEHTLYNMSGIDAYTVGMKHGYTKLAGEGETVSLTLGGAAGYEADHGTLVPNGDVFTLTMEAYDTEISAVDCPVPYNVAVPAATLAARSAQVTWNGGSDSYTLGYAQAVETTITYDFEDNAIPAEFTNSATYAWTVTTNDKHDGSYSIKSGGAGTNYAESDLTLTLNLQNDATISFWYKASSEANYDYGRFLIDGSQKFQTSGTSNEWTQYTGELTAGTHTLVWRYYKDSGSNYGDDCFYVDDITVPGLTVGSYTTINDITASPYTIENLTPETKYFVRVRGNCGSTLTGYCEPVMFTTIEACPAPTGLAVTAAMTTTATLSWTETGEASEWQICLNGDEENLITANENPFTLINLTAATAYTAKVRANCGGDDGASDWTEVVNFTTECAAITVTAGNSFFEDFEECTGTTYNGTSNVNIPTCWENYSDNTSGYVYAKPHILSAGVQYNYATSGQVLYFYGSGNGYAMLPEFTNPLNELAISFMYATESNSYGTLTLGYITAEDENYNTFTAIEGGTFNASSASDDTFVDVGPIVLSSLPATASRLVFRWYYNGQWGANVDDVEVSLVQTITKNITGYGTDYDPETNANAHYYLLASPMAGQIDPANVTNLINTNGYDLFYFDQAGDGNNNEWITYKEGNGATNPGFMLESGTGYLYANKDNVTLSFIGVPYSGDGRVTITNQAGHRWSGWNLIGNPFNEPVLASFDYYEMNSDRTEIIPSQLVENIQPMEGIFVFTTEEEEELVFVPASKSSGDSKKAGLALNVTQGRSLLDRAIVRFGNGGTLPKFQLRQNSTKVYIPMEGKDYAVVTAEGEMGEMPVSFKAETNGNYTISMSSHEVSFSYLHLIDNMTGADVDLLANPTYSFDALTTDYESRFRLVFATGSSVDGDTFGFVNGMGNLTIFGLEGTATLQVMDVTGRVLSSEQFSGSYEKRLNVAPGVYMLRLINGNDVKVQKIVVR